MNKYTLRMSSEAVDDKNIDLEAVSDEAMIAEVEAAAEEYAQDWADCWTGWLDDPGGSRCNVYWHLVRSDGTQIDYGDCIVDIEPDHAVLIASAVADRQCGMSWRPDDWCGDEPEDHDWTSEGEGGCDDNPGVWMTGGTSMVFHTHCSRCGLRRTMKHTGSQFNPGESDTVEYEYRSTNTNQE